MEQFAAISEETIEALRKIRRNRRLLWISLLAGFLIVALSVRIRQAEFLAPIALIFLVGCFIAQIFVFRAKCPSCGKGFFRLWIFYNPYTSKCMNCGIPFKAVRRGA